MSAKAGTVVPKAGTFVHHPSETPLGHAMYAAAMSAALRRGLGSTHHATKIVMRWTGASERAVKHWFAGTRGPSGEYLAMLAGHSDAVLQEFLSLAGRPANFDPDWEDFKARLAELDRIVTRHTHADR